MHRDIHGLPISTASAQAAEAFDRVTFGYLKYRADLPARMSELFAADGEFGLAYCLKGYLAMLSYKQANVPVAMEAVRAARRLTAATTGREQAHVAALEAWISGDLGRALGVWEEILREHPHDVLAFRLAHFNNFWLGRPLEMRASVERVLPKWARDLPGYGTILSCHCFAHEECGAYALAEPSGRAAIEIDPGDIWGTHAVAHIMEMQGRHAEGIAWLDELERHWDGGNNLLHHLWWHRALFHLERREFDAVLDLYDKRFRNLSAALTQAQPDLYIDVQNAASMLFRLELLGIDVGDRWTELADKAEARIGDCLSVFTLPHWMMALAATGREAAALRMIEDARAFGSGVGTVATIVGQVAVPVCEAVLAHRRRDYRRAVALMRPILDDLHQLGGSHAQQDVLMQLFLDAAMKADCTDDVRLILKRVARADDDFAKRVGYAQAAAQFAH
ncbi:MAG: tetratricopeptide repeat protein [Alphaproteobacteria bacterium]|nr:MAG: tetratricopeptide repeat protein [Alphaproteobacteria bacterium]